MEASGRGLGQPGPRQRTRQWIRKPCGRAPLRRRERREGTAWPRWLRTRERLRRVGCHWGGGRRFGDRLRNMANPMAGCGAQQTRAAVCGENRRSREERHGRNESRLWQAGADDGGETRCPEWTHAADVGGGVVLDEPQERSPIALGLPSERTDRANRHVPLKEAATATECRGSRAPGDVCSGSCNGGKGQATHLVPGPHAAACSNVDGAVKATPREAADIREGGGNPGSRRETL